MQLPTIKGIIDRRVLVNYRVDPQRIQAILPSPFRPQLVAGWAIAGICLIRLKQIRPAFFPLPWGIGSENAAHRIAVEWENEGQTRSGVYIPRRDTSSWLNSFAGGRIFPGLHHHADFTISETETEFSLQMHSDDDATRIEVCGTLANEIPEASVFESVATASDFFEAGSLGYSPTSAANNFEGLTLNCPAWHVEPLAISKVHSSFFENEETFPAGSVQFDCALLMRGIEHSWHSQPSLCGTASCRADKTTTADAP